MIDTDKYEETDHPELVEFEGETLGDTLTNLLTEVQRLRRVINDVVVDLTVTNIGGPDGQGVAVKAALNTLSEVIDVD